MHRISTWAGPFPTLAGSCFVRTRVVISVSSRRDGFINGADVNELVHALQSSRLVTILLYSGVAQLCLSAARGLQPNTYYQLGIIRRNLGGGGNSRILVGSVRASYMHALIAQERVYVCRVHVNGTSADTGLLSLTGVGEETRTCRAICVAGIIRRFNPWALEE